jgi:hypothetical protein
VFIAVAPPPSALARECFFNVRDQVAREGGESVLGWTIWEWPSTLIEAEFHAVWRSPTGRLLDLTPKDQGESTILFLEDPTASYDYSRPGDWRDNLRRALADHPDVHRLIAMGKQFHATMNKNSQGREVRLSRKELHPFAAEYQELVARLLRRPVGRRSPCPCGSGGMYGRCCGRRRGADLL